MIEGEVNEERVLVWDIESGKEIFENGWYGKLSEDKLELSLVEAAYLLEKEKLSIKGMNFKKFFSHRESPMPLPLVIWQI